jgi:EAL domain-containing protein (putative c-di-GMP-specific phosphodiesterase class I)
MLEDIAAFCYSKGIKILVEGVEKPEELKICMELGVDYVQGFYFAKPSFELLDPAAGYKGRLEG